MNIDEYNSKKAFLDELTELSKKHGLKICSCGCCDSIWIDKIPSDSINGSYETCEALDSNLKWV